MNILDGEKAFNNGKKIITKVGKSLPVIGGVVTGISATSRFSDAQAEDKLFVKSMNSMGVNPGNLAHQSFNREAAIISAEEMGGNVGATMGGTAGTVCAVGAPACVIGGAVVGDAIGSEIGGNVAGKIFDYRHRLTNSDLQRIRSQATGIIVENPSGGSNYLIQFNNH